MEVKQFLLQFADNPGNLEKAIDFTHKNFNSDPAILSAIQLIYIWVKQGSTSYPTLNELYELGKTSSGSASLALAAEVMLIRSKK